jgi:hypothetical protein
VSAYHVARAAVLDKSQGPRAGSEDNMRVLTSSESSSISKISKASISLADIDCCSCSTIPWTIDGKVALSGSRLEINADNIQRSRIWVTNHCWESQP